MFLKFASNRVFPEQHLSAAAFHASAPALPNANRIMDGLYIGDFQLALQVLRSHDHMKVTHMLSLVSSSILSSMCNTRVCPCPPASISSGDDNPSCPWASISSGHENPSSAHLQTAKHGPSLLRMVVPLLDTPEEDILQVLEACFKFIDEGRKHGTVLVHCMAGRSRSAAIIIAYLMRTLKLSMKQAMDMVNTNYKKASPNVGYMRQLEQFEMQDGRWQGSPQSRSDEKVS